MGPSIEEHVGHLQVAVEEHPARGAHQRCEPVEPLTELVSLERRNPPFDGSQLDELSRIPGLIGPRIARWWWRCREVEPTEIGTKSAPRRSGMRWHGAKRLSARAVDPLDDKEWHREDLQGVVERHERGRPDSRIDGGGDGACLAPGLCKVAGVVSRHPQEESSLRACTRS